VLVLLEGDEPVPQGGLHAGDKTEIGLRDAIEIALEASALARSDPGLLARTGPGSRVRSSG
jgi:hypothetical protein